MSYDDAHHQPHRSLRSQLPASYVERCNKTSSSALAHHTIETTKKSPLKTSTSLTTTPSQTSTLQPNVVTSKNKRNSSKRKKQSNNSTTKDSSSVLEAADVFPYSSELLLYKDDGGKELLRAGSIDALIVLATQSYKNNFLFEEAFVATYRDQSYKTFFVKCLAE